MIQLFPLGILEALPKKLVRSILTGTHELVHLGMLQLLEILAGTHELVILQKLVR